MTRTKNKNITSQAQPANVNQSPKVNHDKNDYDVRIWQHGYDVVFEKALKCPCKEPLEGGFLSNCQNCGGTGWLFINPLKTRMVLSSMGNEKEFEIWSELDKGDVNVTARSIEDLAYFDRITVLNGLSRHQEVLYPKLTDNNRLFNYTLYNIKQPFYVALFRSPTEKLQILKQGEDYTFENNVIYLDDKFKEDQYKFEGQLSLTIRYEHRPQFHIVKLVRDVMSTFIKEGNKEKSVELPISAIARRPHYMEEAENLAGDRLFDNTDWSCEQLQDQTKICW